MRFSVVIPLFNKASYVVKAIESVLAQTYQDFELVVVDDGSEDNSLSYARSALEKCNNPFQLIIQNNAGVSTARNNGVAACHGDYLCFLDADDWWAPTFLERMDDLISMFPDAGIYGTNYYYVKNGRKRVCITSASTGYINYCQVYSQEMSMPLTSISVAIRSLVFNEFNGFKPNLKLGEDFDLWIRIALKYRVAFLNEPLAFYNQDSCPEWRGTAQLTEPQYHMLWNMDYLSEEERINPDYKRLIDGLRTYSLFPYYLSKDYRQAAIVELDKVDWERQPSRIQSLYKRPVFILRCRYVFLKYGSAVKQWICKHL